MADSIQEMLDKFKYVLKDDGFYYGTIIVLVGVICFGLGRWSVSESLFDVIPHRITVSQSASLGAIQATSTSKASVSGQKMTLEQLQASTTKTVVPPVTAETALYIGSKKGTKYHLLTCPGAKHITDANKIYFASKEDAMKSGYTPASNCKGI